MANLELATLRKPGRAEAFVRRIIEQRPFILLDGSEFYVKSIDIFQYKSCVHITYTDATSQLHPNLEKDLIDIETNKILCFDVNEKCVSIRQIFKDKELGSRNSLCGENHIYATLQKEIETGVSLHGAINIFSADGRINIHDVVGIEKIKASKKADLKIKATNDYYVSSKDGSTSKDFNQYGGLSNIKYHSETTRFVESVKEYLKMKNMSEFPEGGLIKSKINDSDNEISKIAMYGSDMISSITNENNVNAVIQGPINLENYDANNYKLSCNQFWIDKEIPKNDYAPCFTARRGDRNDMGIINCRMGIFTVGYRKHIDLLMEKEVQLGENQNILYTNF